MPLTTDQIQANIDSLEAIYAAGATETRLVMPNGTDQRVVYNTQKDILSAINRYTRMLTGTKSFVSVSGFSRGDE